MMRGAVACSSSSLLSSLSLHLLISLVMIQGPPYHAPMKLNACLNRRLQKSGVFGAGTLHITHHNLNSGFPTFHV